MVLKKKLGNYDKLAADLVIAVRRERKTGGFGKKLHGVAQGATAEKAANIN